MASRVEENLARAVLATLRGQPHTTETNAVARAARRVLDGKGTAADVQTIRDYRGVRRSGAGSMRRTFGGISTVAHGISSVTRDVELASGGSLTSQARVAQTVADVIATAVQRHRKAAIAVGEAAAKAVGADPALASRFVLALGRVARLGGAIGMVTGTITGAGVKYFDALQRGYESETKMHNTWWRLNSRSHASGLEAQARADVEAARFVPDTGLGVLDDLLHARASQKAEERFERLAKMQEAKRSLQIHGGSTALAEAARASGGTVESLTDRQLNTFLDSRRRQRRLGGFTVTLPDPTTPTENEVKAHMDSKRRDLRMGMDSWWAVGLSFSELWYAIHPEAYAREWRLEAEELAVAREQQFRKGRVTAGQEVKYRMSEAAKRTLAIREQEAKAQDAQYRSLHQAVIPD